MGQTTEATGAGSESTAGQAQEKAREVAGQAQQQLQERAQEVREQAGGRMRSEVDQRSTDIGRQITSVGDALRQTGEQLRSQDGGERAPAQAAGLVEAVAHRVDRLGTYLTEADADRILGDIEDVARRQPWLIGAGAFVVGFAASRLLKASSTKRYESRYYGAQREALPVAAGPVETIDANA